jgi:hypothetical protein
VYSFNITDSQASLSQILTGWALKPSGSQAPSAIRSLSGIQSYFADGLKTVLQSDDAIAAHETFSQSPNAVLSMYYQLQTNNLFLLGAPELTEILYPDEMVACASEPLVDHLGLRCMQDYEIVNQGRIIRGPRTDFSSADGEFYLVYDFSAYVPSPKARMISLDFNVFDGATSNIGIAQIVFERTPLGDFQSTDSVVTIPNHFVYLGGSGSSGEWALVAGHILILIGASVSFLFVSIRKVLHASMPSQFETVLLIVSVLCIVSFGLQFAMMTSTPLATVNLGIERSINLSEVAYRFSVVNVLNSIVIALMLVLVLLTCTSLTFSPIFALLCVMLIFSLVLTVRFPALFSFGESFMLFTYIGLRYISDTDFSHLAASGGFSLAALLVFQALVFYWLTGVVIGTFTSSRVSRNPPTPDKQNQRRSSILVEENSDILASVEVLGGRALTEITALKESIEDELQSVRQELVEARARIAKLRQSINH